MSSLPTEDHSAAHRQLADAFKALSPEEKWLLDVVQAVVEDHTGEEVGVTALIFLGTRVVRLLQAAGYRVALEKIS